MNRTIPVVDVFAGCGGLGKEFSAFERSGGFPFDVRLCIEKEAAPIRTLQLRAFYHQFREGRTPCCYYEYLSGEIGRDELFRRYPTQANEVLRRCLEVELGNSEIDEGCINNRISQAVAGASDWVLIGGPPCQAYSTIGRARNNTVEGYNPDTDVRFELYREYLRIIAVHWPAVFVMENVRGLLSASYKNQSIFDRMVSDLSSPAQALAMDGIISTQDHKYKLYSVSTKPSRLDGSLNPPDFVVKSEHLRRPPGTPPSNYSRCA